MKKLMLLALCAMIMSDKQLIAQEKCATDQILNQVLQDRPEYLPLHQHLLEHKKNQIEALTDITEGPRLKTTAPNIRVPVVFHVILSQIRINQLGGVNGILQRAMDQINVLNEDYNRGNADSVNIPAPFKARYANVNISFGLAHRKPDGSSTNGVEIKTTTLTGFSATSNYGSDPKADSTGGLYAWNADNYLNIWIVDISEGGILGYTIPPSFQNFGFSKGETGVVLDYGAFGRRGGTIQYFTPGTNDKGRTATHEVGHFFEAQHIFGENSFCPGAGDVDDGFADTPPQAKATYNSSFPNGTPTFPYIDSCSNTSPGLMWMNYMDYVDDAAMYMFTQQQAAFMYTQVAPGGESQTLGMHPELFDWPTDVSDIEAENGFNLFPNPTTGHIHLSFTDASGLTQISVVNLMGQKVYSISVNNNPNDNYDINLTGLSKGVYMVQCTFATGTITKKIVLQ